MVGLSLAARLYGVSTLQLVRRDRHLWRPSTSDTSYHFPHFNMIYQVKLQYGFVVDAADQATAHAMAVRALRENPSSHISGIKQASAPRRKTSLLMRIIKGV